MQWYYTATFENIFQGVTKYVQWFKPSFHDCSKEYF